MLEGAILYRVVIEGLYEGCISTDTWMKGVSHGVSWTINFPSKCDRKCKSPEMRVCMKFLNNSKGANVTRARWRWEWAVGDETNEGIGAAHEGAGVPMQGFQPLEHFKHRGDWNSNRSHCCNIE